jgi:hypothetical protein
MANVISDLKYAVLADLELIRKHLEANPPRKDQSWVAAGPKRADREDLRVGDHRPAVVGSETRGSDLPLAARIPDADPALTRLKELLAVLNQIFIREPETVATVAELSRLTKQQSASSTSSAKSINSTLYSFQVQTRMAPIGG